MLRMYKEKTAFHIRMEERLHSLEISILEIKQQNHCYFV